MMVLLLQLLHWGGQEKSDHSKLFLLTLTYIKHVSDKNEMFDIKAPLESWNMFLWHDIELLLDTVG
jgi:hypothetical protein